MNENVSGKLGFTPAVSLILMLNYSIYNDLTAKHWDIELRSMTNKSLSITIQ